MELIARYWRCPCCGKFSRRPPDANFTRKHDLAVKNHYSGGRANLEWRDVDDPAEWTDYVATVKKQLANVKI